MRYTVNYGGARFCDDSENFNTHWYNDFQTAVDLLYDLAQNGFKDAYLKDEEYQCVLRWDEDEKCMMWEG